jgi:hypothetical protein
MIGVGMSKEFYWTKMSSKTNFANTIREGDGDGTLITSEVAVNRLNFMRTKLTETSKLLYARNAEVKRLNEKLSMITKAKESTFEMWEATQDRVVALEDHLRDYGEHTVPCGTEEEGPCTCGFEEARAVLDEGGK